MSTEVFPLPISGAPREYAVPTAGAVGRRVAFGLDPAGLARDDRIVWSSANLQSYGGTFVSWSSVRTQNLVLDPIAAGSGAVTSGQKAQPTAEVVTVTSSPGQIKLTRIARGKTDLAGTHSIDVAIMPGGAVVNDTILTSLHLWKEDGSALPVSDVHFVLSPLRHPPGLDVVQASIQVDFIIRLGQSGEEWACSGGTRASLVDEDAVRLPLWDLGLASENGSRGEWLALFKSDVGGVRMIFDSSAAASSFAAWLQATQITRVLGYSIGAFAQRDLRATRPYGSLDAEMLKTFRPLQAKDFARITVASVGEP